MNKPPESYPFLRIAKQYGIPYADVLQYADFITHYRGDQSAIRLNDANVRREISRAVNTQSMIRRGTMDWQTGEYYPTYKAIRYNGKVWSDPDWHCDATAQARRELFPNDPYPVQIEKMDRIAHLVDYGYVCNGVFNEAGKLG